MYIIIIQTIDAATPDIIQSSQNFKFKIEC